MARGSLEGGHAREGARAPANELARRGPPDGPRDHQSPNSHHAFVVSLRRCRCRSRHCRCPLSYSSDASAAAMTVTGAKTYGQTFSRARTRRLRRELRAGGKVCANDYDALPLDRPALCGSASTGAGLFCTMFNRPLHEGLLRAQHRDEDGLRRLRRRGGRVASSTRTSDLRLRRRRAHRAELDRLQHISVAGLKAERRSPALRIRGRSRSRASRSIQASSRSSRPHPDHGEGAGGRLARHGSCTPRQAPPPRASVEPFAEVDGVFSAGVGISTVSVGIGVS